MEEHDIHPEDYYIVTGVGLWVEEYEQFKKQLAERLEEAGFHEVRVTKDYAGLDRVVSGVWF